MNNETRRITHVARLHKKASPRGPYGLDECKASIAQRLLWEAERVAGVSLKEFDETSRPKFELGYLVEYLQEYQDRADKSVMFNDNMVTACYQMILERLEKL